MNIKFILISAISSFLSGMGLGGGSVFIIFALIFLKLSQKTLQGLNLIMFIVSGISATIFNLKNKKVDKKISKKIIPCLIIGSVIGVYLVSILKEATLRKYFLVFITIIGLYEIISSLINIKKAKNNSKS